MTNSQIFVMEETDGPYILTIESSMGAEGSNVFINSHTNITFVASGEKNVRLRSTKLENKNIFDANFSVGTLGIGGLEKQLTDIFRRVFASRRLPYTLIERFGIKHIKGILLYGPPGTGKTLIARQLSKALKARSLQIVNGPEIFSKFIGDSEENIRKLFEPARKDEKKYGDESPLHVIVFDEIDAICKQRGSGG